MTQEDLAKMLNVTAQAVSKWEKGLSLPDISILPALGYVLSLSMNELLIVKAAPFNSTADSLIFSYDFTDSLLDHWEDAEFVPNYAGMPQTLKPALVDNKEAILIQSSDTPTCKRRGIASKETIALIPNTVVELSFKPLGDIDGIMELWLYDKTSSNAIRVAARGGNYGEDRQFISEVSGMELQQAHKCFHYNVWQTFHIEVKPHVTVISLLDADRRIIQSHYHSMTPNDLFQQYHLVISQELGYPNDSNDWHRKAYIESLKGYEKNNSRIIR
ncbi:XRE family transcriptional regulator [Paenibacillaceae bacterium]|nr:XRE family transcriptional regulator [Paenibacillaceae bacterium]